jgi:peptidoglycan/LPS O-acetylase OafA/YrhL
MRILSLDVLRGVAILLVICAHLPAIAPGGWFGAIYHWWQHKGLMGVPLFFALSGYLISGLIFNEIRRYGSFHPGRFLIRRSLKLYPAYFVFLIYLIAMPTMKAIVGGGDAGAAAATMASRLAPSFFFLQSYIGQNPATHTWSLAVEEHFYLLLPFAVLLLYQRGKLQWLMWACLLSPVIFTVVRLIGNGLGDPWLPSLLATHTRIDNLAIGVGIRAVQEFHPAVFEKLGGARGWWLVLGIALVPIPIIYMPASVVSSGLILLGTLHCRVEDFGRMAKPLMPFARGLGWIGLHSYSIYLWHVTMMGIVDEKILSRLGFDLSQPGPWILNRFLLCCAIVSGGWLMARIIEWPVLKLRDRYFPSRSKIYEPQLPKPNSSPPIASITKP